MSESLKKEEAVVNLKKKEASGELAHKQTDEHTTENYKHYEKT